VTEGPADPQEDRPVRVTRFMLDTDTVSFAMRGQGGVTGRIVEHRPSELCVSSITVAELRHGAARRGSTKLHQLIDKFLANVAALPFDEKCAGRYGELAALLADRGTRSVISAS
jgi:tRNA(fMet)-specific endonuclease VapC